MACRAPTNDGEMKETKNIAENVDGASMRARACVRDRKKNANLFLLCTIIPWYLLGNVELNVKLRNEEKLER